MTIARPSAERVVQSDGARLWTTASGSGPPVVFFNGGPGCDDYLEPVARLIDDTYRVIRFEPRGCGRSDWDGRAAHSIWLTHAAELRAELHVALAYVREETQP